MPTVSTNYFRTQLGYGNINLSGDTFYVSLMDNYVTSSTVDTLKGINTWSEVSAHECTGTGYSSSALSNVSFTSADNVVYMDADDITWNNVTVSAYGDCIRKDDGTVVGFHDYSNSYTTPITPVNGVFSLQWDSSGILTII